MDKLRRFMTGRYGGDQLSNYLLVLSVVLAIISRIKDSRTHKYYKCSTYKTTLRVPKAKGKIVITCPKCREKFVKNT